MKDHKERLANMAALTVFGGLMWLFILGVVVLTRATLG